MEPAPQEQDPSAPAIKFRNTTKKRKALRQRAQDDQHHQGHQQPDSPSSPTRDTELSSVTAALRARNARKHRLRGVGFSTDSQADDHAAQLPAADDDSSKHLAVAKGIPDRFMHQTGLVSNLNDKHMYVCCKIFLSLHDEKRASYYTESLPFPTHTMQPD